MKKSVDRRKFVKIAGITCGLGLAMTGPSVFMLPSNGERSGDVTLGDSSVVLKHTRKQQWTAKELWDMSTSQGLQFQDDRIILEGHILIEDDASGLGTIDEGSWEIIKKGTILKKTLMVDRLPDTDAKLAILIYAVNTFDHSKQGKLQVRVNGNDPIFYQVRHNWTSISISADYIKTGKNEIQVTTEDSESIFRVPIALYDNYRYGSLEPHTPNFQSARSLDNGLTWAYEDLGVNNNKKGEYPIRLNLRAYKESGWLQTNTIDMAASAQEDILKLPVFVESSRFLAKMGDKENVLVKVRKGNTQWPEAGEWTDWQEVETNGVIEPGHDRYVQFRIEFISKTSKDTPILNGFQIDSEFDREETSRNSISIVDSNTYPLIRSSYEFQYENTLLPALQKLRTDYHLDNVVKGTTTEFEKILKLRGWVAKHWDWFLPDVEVEVQTEWNAFHILDDMDRKGNPKKVGGYCLYYSIVLAQACQSFGIPARIVNINHSVMGGHEVVEVWSRDYGKWIMMDANFDSMFVCKKKNIPLNVLELHHIFLDTYYPDEVMDRDSWTIEDRDRRSKDIDVSSLPIQIQTGGNALSGQLKDYVWWKVTEGQAPGYAGGYGFFNTAFLRWLPRSNWLSQPLPMPINHGRTHWGWDGYLAWTDAQTPMTNEHGNFVSRESDLYENLFSVDFSAEPTSQDGLLRIVMATNSPNLRYFEIKDNNKILNTEDTTYLWKLSTGINMLEIRAFDMLGNKGPTSYLTINFIPK
ncbi:transglutaminase-like domain-containing protein [Flagellimonas olearia]|uniref:Transglutaminase-like domain-containing protein n=1 Tax=Flagellimonas olearia TaxID=552546 RepID=A0A444VRP7_9FLAO|nr:transglutaminase-like domain-containing protein [Allomuricauda olearia]RYC53494.1 hypothetical protein DN53_04625 [Allomuricauda olearia]